jgi:hypothetical protein
MTHITDRQAWRGVGHVARGTDLALTRPNLAVTTPRAGRNKDFHRAPLPTFTPLAFVTSGRRVDRGPNIARSYAANVKNMQAAAGIAAKLDRFRGHRG